MLLSTAEDLALFVDELKRESDRGLALVGVALIDDKLGDTLKAFFREGAPNGRLVDDPNAPLSTFSSRADACYALGLIDHFEFAEIGLLRKVRNEFAHAKHGLSFQSPRVQGLCSSLKADLPQDAGYPLTEPRFRYTNSVVAMALRLYHRPDWVALERRTSKGYFPQGETTWRSFAQNPPPNGRPFLAIGKAKPER
ncbi:transcriptional regulator [Zhengella mangrovi]|uniref:Transcriptional regulator n=1 Tax=Zhengella mangrovi TaxID=1982044 RepID=A0A2G1QMV1_9HYPH|nr:transcriptional regulator [Zhengella mangrovi]PHP66799.1 transcriptional regulator [Zhengella mangrovi]